MSEIFWKLYLTIMLTVVTCFSIGGYLLIETGFKSSLQREIEMAYQENDILFSSFINEIFTLIDGYVDAEYSDSERFSIIQNSATTLRIQTFNGSISFCLRDKRGKMLYQNGGFSDDVSLIKKLNLELEVIK